MAGKVFMISSGLFIKFDRNFAQKHPLASKLFRKKKTKQKTTSTSLHLELCAPQVLGWIMSIMLSSHFPSNIKGSKVDFSRNIDFNDDKVVRLEIYERNYTSDVIEVSQCVFL